MRTPPAELLQQVNVHPDHLRERRAHSTASRSSPAAAPAGEWPPQVQRRAASGADADKTETVLGAGADLGHLSPVAQVGAPGSRPGGRGRRVLAQAADAHAALHGEASRQDGHDSAEGVGVTAALVSRGVYTVIDSRWVNPIFDRAAVEVALGAMPARHLPERRGTAKQRSR